MTFFLAIDQGTTSTRAIIFNELGQPLTLSQHDFQQYYPDDGWVEHDPEEIWQTTLQSCREAIQQAGLKTTDITGIGITNQRETSIVWDKQTGVPIHRAIVWQDRRTASHCDTLKAQGLEPRITEKTGLLLDPYFSATKLMWLLEHVPGARERATRGELLFGTIETFLLWRLTGGQHHYSDITNASRTLLFNIHTEQWDDELLALFHIPPSLLPRIVNNHGDFGSTLPDLLGTAIPICAMAGDQQAAAFGQACFSKGMVKSTYGTGCFMLLHTGKQIVRSAHQLLSTIQYRLPNDIAYGLEGSIFIAGAAVQWLRDGLQLIQTSSDIETLSNQVTDNGGVYFVPAFTGLGAPYWNPHARGAIVGLTRDTKAAHLAKATLEAVCYQSRDLVDALHNDGVPIARMRVDGGMSVNNELLQFLADILQIEVQRPRCVETAALGVAYLTGLQQGIYKSLEEISQLWQLGSTFQPRMSAQKSEQLYQKWQHWVNWLNKESQQ